MRYAVRFQPDDRRWAVIDTVVASQIVGIHGSETQAYKQAFAEQERWRKFDPLAQHLGRLRTAPV